MELRGAAPLLLVSLVIVSGIQTIDYSGSSGPESGEKYNIVIISVDALRSDHLSCYGYQRNLTPNICNYGDPIIFENAYSQAPWSLQSYVSILTGNWPFKHGEIYSLPIGNDNKLLPEVLSSLGYRTGGVVNAGMLGRWFDFYRGFGYYRNYKEKANGSPGRNEDVFRTGSKFIMNDTAPAFVFLHTMEVHSPYNPSNMTVFNRYRPEELNSSINITDDRQGSIGLYRGNNLSKKERRYLISGYDTTIKQTDRAFGDFMSRLNRSGELDNTIVILTSDHGESFQDHSLWVGHVRNLYEEYIKVPLVIYHPDIEGKRIEERVRLIDIYPTVLDFIGYDDYQADGRSLKPLIEGTEDQSRTVYSSTYGIRPEWRGGINITAVIEDDIKLIWYREKNITELYNLSEDPDESEDLSGKRPELVSELKERITNLRKGKTETKQNDETDEKVKERLDELGYLN